MKVAFLTNIVSPYRLPVFQRLAATPNWDFRVFVNADTEFDRKWKVDIDDCDVQQTKSWSIKRTVHSEEPIPFDQVITLHLPVGLWSDLRRFRPDVVISHELGPRTMVAAAYCRRHRIPLVIWSYQSLISASQGSKWRQYLRRRLLKRASAVVGMGTQAREVLRTWGATDASIVDAPNAANHDTLLHRYNTLDSIVAADRLRQQYGDGRRIAAVFGRLVPLKGTAHLLEHWSQLPDEVRQQWRLVFVGDGPLASLVNRVDDPSVVHAGQAKAELMADWYQASDLHIFPTLGDVWGLVVNEAMSCGVPTLCSVHAGCCPDMIQDGVNGLTYDPTQSDATSKLEKALTQADLKVMGVNAHQTVKSFTLDRLANGFREAVSRVTQVDHGLVSDQTQIQVEDQIQTQGQAQLPHPSLLPVPELGHPVATND